MKGNTMESENEILTAKEAAEYLRISVAQLKKLAKKGEIKHERLGRLWRFKKGDLWKSN